MATRYRFGDSQYPHFITFAVINWIDALSRLICKNIIVNSLKHCQKEKGLIINGWIIMSNPRLRTGQARSFNSPKKARIFIG